MNAVQQPESVLLLGGTSEIGLAIVRELPRDRLKRIVLAGRPGERLDAAADHMRAAIPAAAVEVVAFDADAIDTHRDVLAGIFAGGDIDVMILAFGVLGDQAAFNEDPSLAIALLHTNFIGGASALLNTTQLMKGQGHGSIIVMSSVAADRGRADNFVYGSSKAGLDTMSLGLADSLVGSGVSVLVVRPGFVHTRMTEGLQPAPFSTNAETVAEVAVSAWSSGKVLVYAPHVLRAVMGGLKALPRPVFRKLSER